VVFIWMLYRVDTSFSNFVHHVMQIPFYSLTPQHDEVSQQLRAAFEDVLQSNWYVLGKACHTFEEKFAAYHTVPYCVTTGNGLDALYLSLRALGVGPGDEVIVPAHTYVASWLAVSRAGASIVPVDVDQRTWQLEARQVATAITSRTKAVMPVHLYGLMCDMQAMMQLAKQHNLRVIEDSAQATGASCHGKRAGTFGDCGAFSFYPTKNLGALGDGGAVLCSHRELQLRLTALRNYGQHEKYDAVVEGVNSRLDELQAAMLSAKLALVEKWNEQRREIARWYSSALSGVSEIKLPLVNKDVTPSYHLFPISVAQRELLQKHLTANGIHTMIHYPKPPFRQQVYNRFLERADTLPVADGLAKTELSLPIWPGMNEAMVTYIGDQVKAFYQS
jgi:dTDP-4-amino-4,6-dideoxygalactose transaminase